MASGFFALLDDISVLMDDVLTMSKITTKKTAGILGDDLAVNAEKASGFVSSRELPVLWAITKGSLLNKLIILPIAFLLSASLPWAITVILVLGGVYLAFEGAEKIYEFFVPKEPHLQCVENHDLSEAAILDLEKKKIRSAVLTDFILSIEIVIIALGTVIEKPLLFQILVVSFVAIVATIGVYGIVAVIVRMDDIGLRMVRLSNGKNNALSFMGHMLVNALPLIIKALSVVGTIALLLVAGGIFIHNIDDLHHFLESWPGFLRDFVVGLAVGVLALLLFKAVKGLFQLVSKK
jgi:hypothetical protein